MMHDSRGRCRSGALSVAHAVLRGVVIAGLTVLVRPPAGRAQPFESIQFRVTQKIAVAVGADAGPNAVTLFDVNVDGNMDIVAIDQDDDAIWVLYGHGDGTFDVPEDPIDLLVTPTAVVVADIASPEGPPDNKPDIIVAAADGDVAEILLADASADSGFSSDDSQDLGEFIDSGSAVALALGTFDASPEIDLAILDESDAGASRVFFICNASGNFTPCASFEVAAGGGQGPVDLAAGDFDGDGHRDVAVLSQESHTYTVMYGDGNGGFTAGSSAEAKADTDSDESVPFALAAGKLDGPEDTLDDLVIADADSFSDVNTLVAHSQGNRFERITETGPFSESTSVALGDINADGLLDAGFSSIAPTGETTLGPAFLVGDGTGGFIDSLASVRIVGGSMGEGLAIAMRDINKDANNLADVVQVSADGERIDVALNISNQAPAPTDTPTVPVVGSPTATRTVTPTQPTATITATRTATATGTPSSATYGRCIVRMPGSPAGVAVGDLDGNGGDDIALSDAQNNVIYLINGTEVRSKILTKCPIDRISDITLDRTSLTVPDGQQPGAIVAVDLDGDDGDGQEDLVVIGTDRVLVFWNEGGGVFSATPTVLGPFPARPAAIVADVPDPSAGDVARMRLDLDGDRNPDIVVAVPNENRLRIFYGAGRTFTESARSAAIPEPATALAAGDFDGGFVDLAVGTARRVLLLKQDVRDAQRSHFVGQEPLLDSSARALMSGLFDNNQLADLVLTRQNGVDGSVELHLGAGVTPFATFATSGAPGPAVVGSFNSANMTSDVAAAGLASVTLALGNGTGGLPTVLKPFAVFDGMGTIQALAAGAIDGDLIDDVVTANVQQDATTSFGTVSFILSADAPATPTPTPTLTGTITNTPSPTPTPATPTGTPVATATVTGTVVTASPSPSATPKVGAFALSSCSINDRASDWPMHALVLLAALGLIRGRRRSGRRGLPMLLLAAILGSLLNAPARAQDTPTSIVPSPPTQTSTATVTETARATDTATATGTVTQTGTVTETGTVTQTGTATPTSTPTNTAVVSFGWCTVGRASLGNPTGALAGGIGIPLDFDGGDDLALLYDDQVAVARIDIAALRARTCSSVAAPFLVPVQRGRGLAAAQLDDDLLNDLIVTEQNSDVETFHNGGDGTVSTLSTRTAAQPGPVAVGQLDADTIEDLVIGSGENVAVLQGTGNGAYRAPVILPQLNAASPSTIRRVIVKDINLDGFADIVAVNQNGTFGFYLQNVPPGSAPSFATPVVTELGEAPEDLIVEDINPGGPSDRVPDVLYVTSMGLYVKLGSVSGATVTFAEAVKYTTSHQELPSAVAVIKFNAGDNLDVLVADAGTDLVHVFTGDGRGGLTANPINDRPTGPSPNALIVADLDGDQKQDFTTTNRGDGSITIFLSTAATPTPTATYTPTIITPTPTLPPTITFTVTATPTQTATATASATSASSATATPEATPTSTFGGFEVMGSCAVADTSGLTDAMPLLVLAVLALLRRRAKA